MVVFVPHLRLIFSTHDLRRRRLSVGWSANGLGFSALSQSCCASTCCATRCVDIILHCTAVIAWSLGLLCFALASYRPQLLPKTICGLQDRTVFYPSSMPMLPLGHACMMCMPACSALHQPLQRLSRKSSKFTEVPIAMCNDAQRCRRPALRLGGTTADVML